MEIVSITNNINVPVIAHIVELFESIQGEGKNCGKLSIFIRLYGCNLKCRFNNDVCDTPQAVHNKYNNAVKIIDYNQLVNKIVGSDYKSKHIVWTGGEPMLRQEFIIKTMKQLYLNGYSCEIETNGTLPLKEELNKYVEVFTLSVKLKNSNQPKETECLRIIHKSLETYPRLKTYFKFVVKEENDIKEIKQLTDKYRFITYLMPCGYKRTIILNNNKKVAEMAIKYGYNFSPRLHIEIWNNKKGI